MKIIASMFSFALGLGLILFSIPHPADRSTLRVGETQQSRGEGCECEGEAESGEKFRYANRMDPRTYLETYEAIRSMPGESREDTPLRKGVRSTSVNDFEWESFGPVAVPEMGAPGGNKLFGRIRRMKWYYNTGAGMWEIYLGAGSGGLWYGTGDGNWVSVGDRLSNPAVGAIAIDPVNPGTIFVGTGDWGRDNGAGMFKTTNQGQTWAFVALPTTPVYITEILYLVGSSIMIMSSSSGVFKSTNGGSTWQIRTVEPTQQSAGCYNLVAASVSTLYATLPGFGADSAGGIYRSADGGDTWSKLSNGLPTISGSTIALDVSTSNTDVMYASYTNAQNGFGGVYRSTNGGSAWQRTPDPPSYIANGQGFHVNVISIRPDLSNYVYAAGVGMVRSYDMGDHWEEYGRERRGHDDITAVEFDPSDADLMYICSDGGIILRDEENATLNNANYTFSPGAPLQVYEMDYAWSGSNVMAAGTQDDGQLVTTGASQPGSTWFAYAGCDGAQHLTIDPNNSSVFYLNQWCDPDGQDPRIRSDSMGKGNVTIDGSLPKKTFVPIRLAKGGTTPLFTVTNSSLYYSYTRGNIWSPAVFFGPTFTDWPTELSVDNYAPGADRTCYITGADGKLYVSRGVPGSMVMGDMSFNLPTPISNCVADRWRPNVAYVLKTGKVFRSTDRGTNWSDITGNLSNLTQLNYNDIISSQNYADALYLASAMGMWKTVDGGVHWTKIQLNLPIASVTRLAIVPGITEDTLRIATYGRGFWQRLINDVDPDYLVQPVTTPIFSIQGKFNRMYATGSVGGALRSFDHGNSWEVVETGTPANLNAANLFGDHSVILAGDAGTVLRSTDDGATWNITSVTTGNITGMSITAGGILWMCADDGSLLKSIDGGTDWMPQPGFAGIPLGSCQFRDDLHGWLLGGAAGGGPGSVAYRTIDGGGSWTPAALPSEHAMVRLFFPSDSEGFAIGDSGTIVRTTDAGESWTTLETGTGTDLHDCFFSGPLAGWVVGDSGIILTTGDGGETWAQARDSTTGDLHAVALSGTNLLLGGDGALYRSSQVHQNTVFYSLNDRWNLVCLPVAVPESSVAALFPTAQSEAYSYGAGYNSESSLRPGIGYWMKFAGDQVATVTGTPSGSVSIPVVAGWNLIGSTSIVIQAAAILSSPRGSSHQNFSGTAEPTKFPRRSCRGGGTG